METIVQDPTHGGDRLQLFNVEEPLALSISESEAKWRGNNVWVQFGNTKTLKKDGRKATTVDLENVMLLVQKSLSCL